MAAKWTPRRTKGIRTGTRRGRGGVQGRLGFLVVLTAVLVAVAGSAGPSDGEAAHERQSEWPSIQRFAQGLFRTDDRPGHEPGAYYTLLDEEGRRVTRTGLSLGLGDTYIDEENRLYEVVSLDGRIARVEFREVIELPDVGEPSSTRREQAGRLGALRWAGALLQRNGGQAGEADEDAPTVLIYHSHNAESYIPTSGTDFKEGPGDVHEVGRALRDALAEEGLNVHWSAALHLPHDGGAYQRSRATVREFLSKSPATMLDVHRDATPPEEYTTEVDGKAMTKVRLVVGRQNQNREANLQYAKELKAIGDRDYPGLIKGIFHARGNYNQDVGPRMILLEFGTHETSLDEAKEAALLMAQVIPKALGVESRTRVGASGWRTAGWVLGLALLATLTYLRINAGSWEAFWQQLRQLVRFRRAGTN